MFDFDLTQNAGAAQLHGPTSFLRDHGAEALAVADLDYVFSKDNPLFAKLEAKL